MNVAKRLHEAKESGEVLRIKYLGGSNPGAIRDIMPLQVNERFGEVRCRCYTSNAVKVFKIDKIELADLSSTSPTWCSPPPPEPRRYSTLMDALPDIRAALDPTVSVIVNMAENSLFVHLPKKRGGGHLKQASASITFSRTEKRTEQQASSVISYKQSGIFEASVHMEAVTVWRNAKYWSTRPLNQAPIRTYGSIDKAVAYFIANVT